MKRLPAVGLGALVAVVAIGIPAAMATGSQGPDPKVIVCKYVGTPFRSELIQTGQNPISVSVNALDDGFSGSFPYYGFKDQQENSVAVRFATGPTDNGTSGDCPVPDEDEKGTLVVKKVVVNDDGGTKVATDFSFTVNGSASVPFDADGVVSMEVAPGDYTVLEVAVAGYTATYDDNTVTVAKDGTGTVTITNDDMKKEEDGKGTLIVKKVVVNDNGGTAEADDFSFRVNGRGPVAFESDGSNSFQVPAGYVATVVEMAAQGYTTTYSESNGGTVEKGGTLTITVTNDDVKGEEPPPPPHEVKGDASVTCILPDGFYRVSGTVDGQAADKVVPATIPGAFTGSTEVTVTRGDTSFTGTVTTDGKCGNVQTPPVVTPPAVVTPPTVTTPPVETTPTTVPTAPLTPPKASTKPAAPAKVKKATTAPTKPKVKVAGAVAGNPPKLAYTP